MNASQGKKLKMSALITAIHFIVEVLVKNNMQEIFQMACRLQKEIKTCLSVGDIIIHI
jgi:hypothetical protein